jgi:DNA-binding beta-propeller fold protein YncE
VKSYSSFNEPGKYGTVGQAYLSNMARLTFDSTGKFLYLSNFNGGAIRRLNFTDFTSTVLAGTDTDVGFANGAGADALFDFPEGLLLMDGSLYVADSSNNQIRKIDLTTDAVTTFAGSKTPASFGGPRSVATDGTYLYVADARDGLIRKVSIASSYTTSLTNTAGGQVQFEEPCGIATDGTNLYVVDGNANDVTKVVIATGELTPIAGSSTSSGAADGIGTAAAFNAPQGIALDPTAQNLYLADQGNNEIRKIVIATGQVTTIAGAPESGFVDGIGAAARFNMPANIAVDPTGSCLYVTDGENNTIRKITLATAEVTTIAGQVGSGYGYKDGIGTGAAFSKPWGIATDGTYAYFAGAGDNMIRRIELSTSTVKTISGTYTTGDADGAGTVATFGRPEGMTLDAAGTYLYVCDDVNGEIRRVQVK